MRRAAARVGQPGLRGFQRKGAWGPEAKTGASREGECLFFKVFFYSYSHKVAIAIMRMKKDRTLKILKISLAL